jgi:4-alpha-glucanotransferase
LATSDSAAIAWIDQLYEAEQSWWQALPLGPTGYGNSPYQALSSFAGNGLLISPGWLIEDGLLASNDGAKSFVNSWKELIDVIASKSANLMKPA